MDTSSLATLAATAAVIGVVHTATGPDHYVPFVAMSKAGGWSRARTLTITLLCGVGHVGSSVVLGILGIALGLALGGLQWFEAIRGHFAGWLLLGFGLAYAAWGVHRAIRRRPHRHWHAHPGGVVHDHEHHHEAEHAHVHAPVQAPEQVKSTAQVMTPWILFTIFVFGPCEPLIPLVMVPAAEHSVWGVVVVTAIFGAATLVTMTTIVIASLAGLDRLNLKSLDRWSHATAGAALAACGLLIQLGL